MRTTVSAEIANYLTGASIVRITIAGVEFKTEFSGFASALRAAGEIAKVLGVNLNGEVQGG